jgi:2-isopropylmalate synthase
MEKIMIFDTTLRDGEQAARGALSPGDKLEIAYQLEKLNIDVIEAGFPAISQAEFKSVEGIAKRVRRPIICALSHADAKAIKAAGLALKSAAHPRIHVFLSVSDMHLFYQLGKTRSEVLEMSAKAVALAKKYSNDVEFSPMDASRANQEYLYKVIESAISSGATTINIPDTVGYAVPQEFGEIIKGIRNFVPNINKAVISAHCHNDLGLATANSLEAIRHGARQIECTINGIGERAGNAALEEIVMTLKARQDFFGFSTNINTKKIYKTSRLVSKLAGFPVQPNKAIVGANAFSHASGIHQDGILKNPGTYEIIDPKDVGFPKRRIILGKLSGRHGFESRLAELEYVLTEEKINEAFRVFKNMAETKKEINNRDLKLIVLKVQGE